MVSENASTGSTTSATPKASTRLILFEVAEAVYAFPIADVLEVLENCTRAGIPTIAPAVGGVVNHHGEALPVISAGALFGAPSGEIEADHLLVLGGIGTEAGQLGVPVERVLGLADAELDDAPGPTWIRDRITLDNRVVAVLDAARCLDRAERAFANAGDRGRAPNAAAAAPDLGELEELVQELSTGEGSQ